MERLNRALGDIMRIEPERDFLRCKLVESNIACLLFRYVEDGIYLVFVQLAKSDQRIYRSKRTDPLRRLSVLLLHVDERDIPRRLAQLGNLTGLHFAHLLLPVGCRHFRFYLRATLSVADATR